MHERFERRIDEGLEKIAASCRKRKHVSVSVGSDLGMTPLKIQDLVAKLRKMG